MSWDKVTGRDGPLIDVVRVSVRGACPSNPRHRLSLAIGRKIAEKLGWNKGNKVDFFYGSGTDKQWVKIELAERGRLIIRQQAKFSGSLIVECGFMPRDAIRQNKPVETVKTVIDPTGALLVKLPKWFYPEYEKKHPNDTHRGRPLAHAARSPAEGALRHNGAQVTPE